MRKFVGVACLVLGLAAVPSVAAAGPIGTNGCGLNAGGVSVCDIYADFTGNGPSALGLAEGNLGSYLLGYTFLLNQTASLADGFQEEDVAHILVIHDNLFELFSNTVFNLGFGTIFNSASSGAAIDGLSPSIGQLAGCPPAPSGAPSLSGVGYCATADVVTVFATWGFGGDGGQDILNIRTGFVPDDTNPPDPAPVPEPGTLSLFVLGGSAAFASIRRRRREAIAKS
jgi:PEP-CTERM motif